MTGARSNRRASSGLLWVAATGVALALGWYPSTRPADVARPGRLAMRVAPLPRDLRTLLHQLGFGSTTWWLAVLAMPALVLGVRRLESHGRGRLRSIATACFAVILLIAVNAVVDYFTMYQGLTIKPSLSSFLPTGVQQDLLPWLAIAGGVSAVEWRRRAFHAALDRERLRAEAAEHRLMLLIGQLQPHFLFNTLQGISTLMHRDPRAADEMLGKLSDLLRDRLEQRDHLSVTLGEEVRSIRTYLDIAKLRFSDRLAFEIDVPPDAQGASVPIFILQPLVENALTHGIGARLAGGRISVMARRHNRRLIVEVADDGPGLSAEARDRIGISNTRERLQATFGADHRFVLEPRIGGGTRAILDIPCVVAETAGVTT